MWNVIFTGMNFRHLHDIAFFCFIFFLKDSQMVTPPQKKKSMYFIFVCLKNMAIKQKLEKFRQLKLVKIIIIIIMRVWLTSGDGACLILLKRHWLFFKQHIVLRWCADSGLVFSCWNKQDLLLFHHMTQHLVCPQTCAPSRAFTAIRSVDRERKASLDFFLNYV